MVGESILYSHIDALAENLNRINNLLNVLRAYKDDKASLEPSKKDIEIQNYTEPIRGKFSIAVNPLHRQLEQLKLAVQQGNLTITEAWDKYINIRKEGQRVFAQCLDFLGGIAVRSMGLENGICDLAINLVSYYAGETGVSWSSVMILGEERLFDDIAQKTQIIRLRFPEWDIWNLPFVAHEFGQLVAGSNVVAELKDFFQDQEERIRHLIVDPNLPPDELSNVAPDISNLRDVFQKKKVGMRAVNDFLEQQCFHMRSLFADAFATYFIGPAYLYARLYLRLSPTDVRENHVSGPSLARRTAFMLGELEQMNMRKDQYDEGPYKPELRRFAELWETVVKAIDPEYPDDIHFGEPYDGWFTKMCTSLQATYRNTGFTIKDWQKAEALSSQFLDPDPPSLPPGLTLSIVLNAAWHCRIRNPPERMKDIEKKAYVLCQQVSSGGGSTGGEGGKTTQR